MSELAMFLSTLKKIDEEFTTEQKDVELVASQANCSNEVALESLKNAKGDIVNAIINILEKVTFEPSDVVLATLGSYLHHLREILAKNAAFLNIIFVLGNEAADLDSMTSAILHSYYLNVICRKSKKDCYIPVMNIPKEDFSLRSDAVWLFQRLGIDESDLIFYPEAEEKFKNAYDENRCKFYLTDHNILASHQQHLAGSVVGILDHHKDEGTFTNIDLAHREITPVGSASTLVAEKIMTVLDRQNRKTALEYFDIAYRPQIIKMLGGTILLDVMNLEASKKKEDLKMVEMMIDFAEYVSREEMNNVFENLKEKRYNQDSLSSYDLLRIDYKQFDMKNFYVVGIAANKMSLAAWFKKDENMMDALEKFFDSRKLNVLIVMTAFFDPESKLLVRELVFFTKTYHALLDELVQYVETKMKLSPLKIDAKTKYLARFFTQVDNTLSRKQLQPIVSEYFENH